MYSRFFLRLVLIAALIMTEHVFTWSIWLLRLCPLIPPANLSFNSQTLTTDVRVSYYSINTEYTQQQVWNSRIKHFKVLILSLQPPSGLVSCWLVQRLSLFSLLLSPVDARWLSQKCCGNVRRMDNV